MTHLKICTGRVPKPPAARAFGEYLHTHPENRNGSDLLSDTLIGHDSDSPESLCAQNNNLHKYSLQDSSNPSLINPALGLLEPPPPTASSKSRLSLERSFSAEEDQQKCVECSLQPARVYTITGESGMLGTSRGSKENLELEVLKEALDQPSTSSSSSSPAQHHRHHGPGGASGNLHHGNHHHHISSGGVGSGATNHQLTSVAGTSGHHHGPPHHHQHLSQPLHGSVSAHNIRAWGEGKECGLACEACPGTPSRSQGSLDLESSTREAGKQHRPPLERMCSVDRVTGLERDFSAGYFSRDPSPYNPSSPTNSTCVCEVTDEIKVEETNGFPESSREKEEKEGGGVRCRHPELISSKVPKAEYVPTIIRRDDPSIIPILYRTAVIEPQDFAPRTHLHLPWNLMFSFYGDGFVVNYVPCVSMPKRRRRSREERFVDVLVIDRWGMTDFENRNAKDDRRSHFAAIAASLTFSEPYAADSYTLIMISYEKNKQVQQNRLDQKMTPTYRHIPFRIPMTVNAFITNHVLFTTKSSRWTLLVASKWIFSMIIN
ncbi:NMDA receptor synaptonuclear signaling and neuronal migration factor [Triplophysa tibetana]|uniref:NMDA receptor synaptonuclear signaling and neuronal migration factor n=1 Tax=Triplophysa tibetana TaxID=1572043 RepID=A0A5A9PDB4_9TELE|nr:NMDA receptor synaptonuclear signaling and neuronal migration factor [Triplophysa tibetana]